METVVKFNGSFEVYLPGFHSLLNKISELTGLAAWNMKLMHDGNFIDFDTMDLFPGVGIVEPLFRILIYRHLVNIKAKLPIGKTLHLSLSRNKKINDVKLFIAKKGGLEYNNIEVQHNGEPLLGDGTIAECFGMEDNVKIVVVEALKDETNTEDDEIQGNSAYTDYGAHLLKDDAIAAGDGCEDVDGTAITCIDDSTGNEAPHRENSCKGDIAIATTLTNDIAMPVNNPSALVDAQVEERDTKNVRSFVERCCDLFSCCRCWRLRDNDGRRSPIAAIDILHRSIEDHDDKRHRSDEYHDDILHRSDEYHDDILHRSDKSEGSDCSVLELNLTLPMALAAYHCDFSLELRRPDGETFEIIVNIGMTIENVKDILETQEGYHKIRHALVMDGAILGGNELASVARGKTLDIVPHRRVQFEIIDNDVFSDLDIDYNMRVMDIKTLLHAELGLKEEVQQLYFQGTMLNDNEAIVSSPLAQCLGEDVVVECKILADGQV